MKTPCVPFIMAAALTVITACGNSDSKMLKDKYDKVEKFMSRKEIVSIMGMPDTIKPHWHGDQYYWEDDKKLVSASVKLDPLFDRCVSKKWSEKNRKEK